MIHKQLLGFLLSVTCLWLSTSCKVRLVGPDDGKEEDITIPIKKEHEISWKRFQAYYDEQNTQWKVISIARKYYETKETNLTYPNFLRAGKEYLIHDLIDGKKLTFKGIAKTIGRIKNSMVHYMNEHKNKTFCLKDFFRFSVQGDFKGYMRIGTAFKDEPWEVQQKLIHELHEKKRNKHGDPHHESEVHSSEAYISGKQGHQSNLDQLRKSELTRRFHQQYSGIEWTDDGRRVVDDDWDEEFPTRERKLHTYHEKKKQDKLDQEEIDKLLDFEVSLDL